MTGVRDVSEETNMVISLQRDKPGQLRLLGRQRRQDRHAVQLDLSCSMPWYIEDGVRVSASEFYRPNLVQRLENGNECQMSPLKPIAASVLFGFHEVPVSRRLISTNCGGGNGKRKFGGLEACS
jgi:hypothetical protein